jgi:hypothetical protein
VHQKLLECALRGDHFSVPRGKITAKNPMRSRSHAVKFTGQTRIGGLAADGTGWRR